ncbi:MAG: DUF1015 domain-containing protein [Desulfuromonadaceae bacterium]
MAKIIPFRGIRYNPVLVRDLAGVFAPPHDVVSESSRERLLARHPHNIGRLLLGQTGEAENDRYPRIAAEFNAWLNNQILVRDPTPSIYLYDQEYHLDGEEPLVRQGIIALCRIEDFSTGLVKPHEATRSHLTADWFHLIEACHANLSPVFALYSDPCCVLEVFGKKEKYRSPDLDIRDDEGVKHRLWRSSESSLIEKVQSVLDSKPLLIAKGHHCYEAALGFRDFMRSGRTNFTGKEAFNYVLICFANMEDPGMRVFPTHRVINGLIDFKMTDFLRKLANYFHIDSRSYAVETMASRREIRQTLAELGKDRHALGLYTGGELMHYLVLKEEQVMDDLFDASTPRVLRTLDVSILHRLILEKILDFGIEERAGQVRYVEGFDDSFRLVMEENAQLAFLMNPTPLGEVREVANSGEIMPFKSTSFYPNCPSGLVFYNIDDEDLL